MPRLSACHFGHAWHRFVSSGLCRLGGPKSL